MGPHAAASRPLTLSEQADELEERMMEELNDKIATKSVLFTLADGQTDMVSGAQLMAQNPGKHFLMGADPRLPKMPEKPTLIDFFKHRFASTNHLLQSATHALKAGLDEEAQVFLCGILNSYVANYLIRMRVSSHVTASIVSRMPSTVSEAAFMPSASPRRNRRRIARSLTSAISPPRHTLSPRSRACRERRRCARRPPGRAPRSGR